MVGFDKRGTFLQVQTKHVLYTNSTLLIGFAGLQKLIYCEIWAKCKCC